jgi:hypothetical protein
MEKSQARPRSVPRPPVPGPGSPNGAHQISNLEPLHLTSSPEINCGWNLEFGIGDWGLGIAASSAMRSVKSCSYMPECNLDMGPSKAETLSINCRLLTFTQSTKVCLISFRCQAITYEYGRGNRHPANANLLQSRSKIAPCALYS